jgi:hypothetical protein
MAGSKCETGRNCIALSTSDVRFEAQFLVCVDLEAGF